MIQKSQIPNPKSQWSLVIGISLVIGYWSLVIAPSSYAVEIYPMRLEHSLQAGKSYSGSFKLSNTSNLSADVFVSTSQYRYIFSSGTVPPAEKEKKTLPSCQDWFKIENEKINLASGVTSEAKFTIKVPEGASGEYLCAVLFDEKRQLEETQLKQTTGNVRIQLTPRFSIPVYISIEGTQKLSARISSMTAVSEPQLKGVRINLTLENTGNAHIRPFGTLIILNQAKEVVKNIPVGRSLPVFPAYKETIPVICPKLSAGHYSAIATVEIANDNIVQKKIEFGMSKAGDVE